MALPPLATVADLSIRLGGASITGADYIRAVAALEDVSAMVRAAAGADMVAEDGFTITAPTVVVTIAIQAALRTYRNPEGYAGESVDGYSWQGVQGEPAGVYLSADEERRIRAAMRSASGALGLGSIRTPSAYPEETTEDLL